MPYHPSPRHILALLLAACLSSCLSETPHGRMPEDQAYTSARDLEVNCVATLYHHIGGNAESQGLQGTYRGVYDWNSLTTDEQMLPIRGGDWYDGGFWQRLYDHTWTADDNALGATWSYLYGMVMRCNHSLAILQQHRALLTDAQWQAYSSEVRALRAIYYAYIMDMWGNVPLVTRDGESLENVRQSPRSQVFGYVMSELQAVAPMLADARSNTPGSYYGRVTRHVAWFALAKLALNAEIYTDDDWTDEHRPSGRDISFEVDGRQLNAWQTVVAYCDKLTTAGYTLAPHYADNFAVNNETSTENIWTIPMDKLIYASQYQYLFRSRHYAHGSAIGMDAENGTVATLSTVRAYGYGTDSLDHRWATNFYADTLRVDGTTVLTDDGSPLVYRPLAVTAYNLTGTPYEKTAGARMSKYQLDRNAFSDGKLQANDIVLFRYGDALLMRAEALTRNGADGSADLSLIRARAGMAPRAATLDNILQERLLEMMWEGWRRGDLIRFGRFDRSYDLRRATASETDHHTVVFPIPGNVLDLNPQLRQNRGYE